MELGGEAEDSKRRISAKQKASSGHSLWDNDYNQRFYTHIKYI